MQALGTATPEMAKARESEGKSEGETKEKAKAKPQIQGKAKAKPKRCPPALDRSTPETATTKKTELQSRDCDNEEDGAGRLP